MCFAVTLIAMKREVAALMWQVFRGANVKLGNWRQVTVQYAVCERQKHTCMTHVVECTVTACRTENYLVRKGGDFFYGKSGYENYIESI